jgi:hypothetical protein
LADDDEAEREQGDAAGAPQTPAPPSSPVAPPSEGRTADAGDSPPSNRAQETRRLAREMNLNEAITLFVSGVGLVVAIGSLVVAYFTYRVTADTTEIKSAIKNLSSLATQTKRSADAQQGQLGLLGQQVQQVKAQTGAISEQTNAIKASSAAAVKSAAAEIKTAEAEVASAQAEKKSADIISGFSIPQVDLANVEVAGLDSKPDPKTGLVTFTVLPRFTNVGTSALYWKGGVFVIVIGQLPDRPDYTHNVVPFGGNDLTPFPGSTFGPSGPVTYTASTADAAGAEDGTKPFIIFGYGDYLDHVRVPHRSCFAARIAMPKGKPFAYFSVGTRAYHCQT